jgi:hypothetical protein
VVFRELVGSPIESNRLLSAGPTSAPPAAIAATTRATLVAADRPRPPRGSSASVTSRPTPAAIQLIRDSDRVRPTAAHRPPMAGRERAHTPRAVSVRASASGALRARTFPSEIGS